MNDGDGYTEYQGDTDDGDSKTFFIYLYFYNF